VLVALTTVASFLAIVLPLSLPASSAAYATLHITSPASGSTLNGYTGTPFSAQIQISGGFAPIAFAEITPNLPSGLSLSQSGLISGTPLVISNQTYSIWIQDSRPLEADQDIATNVHIVISNPPSPSPSESSTPVPDPVQVSSLTGTSPHSGPTSGGTAVTVTGSFPTNISNIQVDQSFVPAGSWTQTPTSITFTTPAHKAGKVSVQIYNGQAPVLAPQDFTYQDATPTPTPTPTPTSTPVQKATLHVISVVKNIYGGTALPSDFTLTLRHHGTDVVPPAAGVAAPGKSYTLPAGTYVLGQQPGPLSKLYLPSFSIQGQRAGSIDLKPGDDLTVYQTNTQLPTRTPEAAPVKRGTVYFDLGATTLNAKAQSDLQKLATVLNAQPSTEVTIYGYADAQPGVDNQKLSEQRAAAVAAFLAPLLNDQNVKVVGNGASNPATTGTTPADYALNRRAEIWVK